MDTSILLFCFLAVTILCALGGVVSWIIYSPKKARGIKGKRRILCIGDSITFGAGVPYTRWKDSYPAILEQKLGDDFQVLNYGISGATLLSKGDKPYSTSFLKAARKTDPEVCILMLGTNDSKPHNWDAAKYQETLACWIADLRNFPSEPFVYIMTPPAAFSVDGNPVVYTIREDVICDQIRPIVKRQAQRYHTGLVDLFAATENCPELFMDGVHPNKQGNEVIAQQIYNALIMKK